MARDIAIRHEVGDGAGVDADWVTGGGAVIGVELAMSGRVGCVSAGAAASFAVFASEAEHWVRRWIYN